MQDVKWLLALCWPELYVPDFSGVLLLSAKGVEIEFLVLAENSGV